MRVAYGRPDLEQMCYQKFVGTLRDFVVGREFRLVVEMGRNAEGILSVKRGGLRFFFFFFIFFFPPLEDSGQAEENYLGNLGTYLSGCLTVLPTYLPLPAFTRRGHLESQTQTSCHLRDSEYIETHT